MYKINEKQFNEMPQELKALYEQLPNTTREEVKELFTYTHGHRSKKHTESDSSLFGNGRKVKKSQNGGESGSVSRYFYCAKASKKDRDEGNIHPTVKPTKLMQYLVRLVTPPGGVVLDPFMGAGSTGKACVLEGFDFIGIEMIEEYIEIAKSRIEHVQMD